MTELQGLDSMERYVCIHGHFYQPPRENPWIEAVEYQNSAYPYHDWNERITAECYAPNGAARILDGEGRIERIVNNYARISFNFGPTLLTWLEINAPETYQALLAADRDSRATFSGHGSALAQAYNHVILPLANSRDKHTQLIWGIRDFEHRFGRSPEGLWLPETAVDLETLEILAEIGLRFTVLAPHQAGRVRKIGSDAWEEVGGGRIDSTMPYALRLPSGRSIDLFFYDGPISRAVAFEELLTNGGHFAQRLLSGFSDTRTGPQLVHLATDGETYGHHHYSGDMALAYALDTIERKKLARLTNYGEFLERYRPTHEVEVVENSSWSCTHGIERWRSDCGCNSGLHPGWNQAWRTPLREALDWLRDALGLPYEGRGKDFLNDPWAARDDYIGVILDRSPENVERFLARHARRQLGEREKVEVLKLLELQRHAMLMYTSCGWFFDEISGIETVQVLQYAGRAAQLAGELFAQDLESEFRRRLEHAPSNLPEHRDGARVYEKCVQPAMVNLKKVAAHYAVNSLFEEYDESTRVYCYTVDRQDYRALQIGNARVAVGRAQVSSRMTRESATLSFGVVHFGDHNLNGAVWESRPWEHDQALAKEVADAFGKGDLPAVLRLLDRQSDGTTYTLKSLFRDEQRKILNPILDATMAEAETLYRRIYERQAPLLGFLADLGLPTPRPVQTAADVVLNADLRRAFESEDVDPEEAARLLEEARRAGITLDTAGLAHVLKRAIETMAEKLAADPDDLGNLDRLAKAVGFAHGLPFGVDLWKAQNVYYNLLHTVYPRLRWQAEPGDEGARSWASRFTALGTSLGIRVAAANAIEAGHLHSLAIPGSGEVVDEILAKRRIPRATYRLQFNRAFTFRAATDLVPYLDDLGVSDVYASPLLRASAESDHGYDICDHGELNPALGSEADFEALSAALQERGMGLLLDTVPNHMGIADPSNRPWMDVLENGPSSLYAGHFDVDWHPVKPELENKVLLPFLEDQYGKVLESGKLQLAFDDGAFYIYYYDTRLPVAPDTYDLILGRQLPALAEKLGEEDEQFQELQSILTALNYLPARTEPSSEKMSERNREKEVIKRRIAALCEASPDVRTAIEVGVQLCNGTVGDPRSFDLMDALLTAQSYRPAYWRVAGEEINYRRFFDVNTLAAIRVELPEVFQATHQLVLRLLAEGKVTGLRIDHPDGLWDPSGYFRQLQQSYLVQRLLHRLSADRTNEAAPARDDLERAIAGRVAIHADGAAATGWPLYVVAEKILSDGEALPHDWAVSGTTGYDFLNAVNGIFIDGRNRRAFDQVYADFTGTRTNFRNLVNSTKKMIMLVSLASEINTLSHHLERIAEGNRWYRDFTLSSLTFAVREVIASLPVYRTYIQAASGQVAPRDERWIEAAVADAKRRNPRTPESVFNFVRDTLLLRNLRDFRDEDRGRLSEFVMKFQQLTGPVMAKGVEDTAFYVYNRLVSLNEVGGNPEQFGISPHAFHRQNLERQHRWPYSLLATSTHDTKRSEDVRARIDVLSELPDEWRAASERWTKLNASKKAVVASEPAPDRNDEYLLYQTLLGVWPFEPTPGGPLPKELPCLRELLAAYLQKATKEAKIRTSWINPNEAYDNAVRSFLFNLLPDEEDAFLADFRQFARRVAAYGQINSLAQVLLKLTVPGVPDIYQGTETWNFSLVDPDNRRPVDFQTRRAMLDGLKQQIAAAGEDLTEFARRLLGNSHDGCIKLYLTHHALDFRRGHDELFTNGSYLPLEGSGEQHEHVCAFARILDGEAAIVVTPRLVVGLTRGREQPPLGTKVWSNTRVVLPDERVGRRYRNLFTGEVLTVDAADGTPGLMLASVLSCFPVALLQRVES